MAPGQLPELDRDADSPLWFQIMRAIEYGISTGLWAPGERLPSEHELCEQFGVSRTSVRGALARLEQQGLVSRRQGQGAFVEQRSSAWSWALPDAPSLLGEFREGDRSALTSRVLRGEVAHLPPWVAAAFRNAGDVDGLVIERLRSVGKLTAVYVVDYLPRRFAGVLPNLRDPRASLFAALERVAGVRISRMHRTIEAVSADRRLSGLLEVEEGYPLVVVEGVGYDEHDNPIDVSRAIVRTDRLRVSVDSGHAAVGRDGGSHPPSGSYPELDDARARRQLSYQAAAPSDTPSGAPTGASDTHADQTVKEHQ